jgi:hypothetical protein
MRRSRFDAGAATLDHDRQAGEKGSPMTTALQADWYAAASRQRWYMRQAERPAVPGSSPGQAYYVARDARITAALRKVFAVTRYRQADHVRGRL